MHPYRVSGWYVCCTVVASQRVVYVCFLVLTVVFCWNFFFRDGLVVLWRSEDVRFFEGGHTVVCVNSSGHWAPLLAHWPDVFCVSVS